MQNEDYQCPRCHHVFPSYNKMMHDLKCTEQNPLPLNQNKNEISKQIENGEEVVPEENKFINDNVISKEKIFTNDNSETPEEKNLANHNNNDDNQINNFNYNNNLIDDYQEYIPKEIKCEKCGQMISENEMDDHKLCHILENEERIRANNSRDNIRISRIDIDEQKKIEKQIQKDNRRKRSNRNQLNQNNNHNNNYDNDIFYDELYSNSNNLIDYKNNNNNFIPNFNSINNNNNNNNQNVRTNNQIRRRYNNNNNNNNFHNSHVHNNGGNNNNVNQRVRITVRQTGPNGEMVTLYSNEERPNIPNSHRIHRSNHNNNNLNNNNNYNRHNNNNIHRHHPVFITRSRIIPFVDINNRSTMGTIFNQIYSNLESGVRGTDREIMNELPETTIEDVSKLDAEKKNCVICLEEFKNKDKAIILPCIHLFHKNCIKNWLKKQNSCPICKFKLTGENMHRQFDNFE